MRCFFGVIFATLVISYSSAQTTKPSPNIESAQQKVLQAQRRFAAAQAQATSRHAVLVAEFQRSADGVALAKAVTDADARLLTIRQTGSPQQRIDAIGVVVKAKAAAQKAADDEAEKDSEWKRLDVEIREARKAATVAQAEVASLSRTAQESERASRRAAYARVVKGDYEGKEITNIPLNGDETPLVAVMADPKAFVNREFTVVGQISVSDFYAYPYENSRDFYFAFTFFQLDGDANRGEQTRVYAKRDTSKDLVDALTALASKRANAAKVVRLRLAISGSPNPSGLDAFQVSDWQFLDPERGNWTAWASEVK